MATLFADPPDWVDNPGGYEFTATMTALIEVNNLQFGDAEDILAAFDENGNVRGVAIQLVDVPFGPHEGTILYEIQILQIHSCH